MFTPSPAWDGLPCPRSADTMKVLLELGAKDGGETSLLISSTLVWVSRVPYIPATHVSTATRWGIVIVVCMGVSADGQGTSC